MDGKYVFAGVCAVVLGLVAYGVGQPGRVAPAQALQSGAAAAPNGQAALAAAPSGWIYTEEADPMRDTKIKIACVASTNHIHQDFPYKNTGAHLCLRQGTGRLDAWVSLDTKGQILCNNSYDRCRLTVRFDKSRPEELLGAGPSDHSSDVVFMRDTSDKALVSKLVGSKQMLVEIELYENGTQALVFPTAGLMWPHG